MDLEKLRQELRDDFKGGPFPDPIPLDLRVISKRTFHDYEEWKIEYQVETADTMPAEAGLRVPAYLLVPTQEHDEPFPAMVCLHQCGEDCAVGKEAVAGKVPYTSVGRSTFFESDGRLAIDRSDQAYGYELVHQGFVVLAPDAINCGERNIESIRQAGQIRRCWYIIDPHLGREAQAKRTTDAMRAVDVLQSLDFVDSERIGGIGHSMGAEDVYWLMAFDDRVKAGILNPGLMSGVAGRFVPLLVPRLYIGSWPTFGHFDPDGGQAGQEAYDFTRDCYERQGAAANLLLRKLECGHRFVDAFKWEAYKRLKEYFGVLPRRERVSLGAVVQEARRVLADVWESRHDFPEPDIGTDCYVSVNRDQMSSAIAGLFLL